MIVENVPGWLKQQVEAIKSLGSERRCTPYKPQYFLYSFHSWFSGIFGDKQPNHVLVNEYLPSQGIMPHTDGPLFHPVIATISCGSHTVLEFQNRSESHMSDGDDCCRFLLEPRSLIIVMNDLYTNFMHSIAEVSQDNIGTDLVNIDRCEHFTNFIGCTIERDRRISLTIRHVPKTSKINLRLGH